MYKKLYFRSTFYQIIKKKQHKVSSRNLRDGFIQFLALVVLAVFKEDYLLLYIVKLFDCVMQIIYIVLYIVYAPKPLRVSIKSVLIGKL